MKQRLIDTHIHVWHFEKAAYEWLENDSSILKRNYNIDELNDEHIKAGVTEGLLVQAANNIDDTAWMLEVAEKTDWVTGVVGWLPLKDPDATEKALSAGYASGKYFRGVRHMIHDEPDPKWLLQDRVVESLRIIAEHDLCYDVVGVSTEHIETGLAVADKVPGLKMVFNHLNQPPIATKEKFGSWGELMAEAAINKNFHAKISGLGTASKKFQSWTKDDIKPYIEFALQHFGTDRCFLGGDWPVCLLAGTYTTTWQVYKDILNDLLDEEEREKVFYKNAEQFYQKTSTVKNANTL